MVQTVEELAAELVMVASRIAAAEAHFLQLLGEFDARGGWAGDGILSLEHWLSWRCAMSQGTARDRVRTARRLRSLPVTREAFAGGEVSYSKVRAIVRVATSETERQLVSTAKQCTAGQLERHVRAIRRCVDAEEASDEHPAAQTPRPRAVTWHYDEDGDLVFSGRLDSEQGAQLLAALEATAKAVERLDRETTEVASAETTERPESTSVRRARSGRISARVWAHLAEAAVSGLDRATPSLAPFSEVVVHVDVGLLTRLRAALSARDGAPRAHVEGGSAVTAGVIERLACDGGIRLTTHGSDGRTLDLGRRRLASGRQSHALLRRDGGCRFPGCGRTRFLHAHHVRHWAHGGATTMDNLILLCGAHHRLLHAEAFVIQAQGRQRFAFRTCEGEVIPAEPGPDGSAAADLIDSYAHVLGDAVTPAWTGDSLRDQDVLIAAHLSAAA